MKTKLLLITVAVLGACLVSCGSKGPKNNDDLPPVERIEALSNDISSEGTEWTKENWDEAADILELAIADMPNPLSDEEQTIFSAAISRIQVYADRQKRKASSVLDVLSNLNPQKEEAQAAPAQAAPQAAPAQAAPAQAVPPSVPAAAPKGLLSGHVIREGGYTNVRQGPGTNYGVVTKIKDGSPIFYTTYNANWCIVYNSAGQQLGYMHSSKVVPGGGQVASVPASRGTSGGTQYDWLSQRKVTAADLAPYDKGQLRVLRNSIYARHGRKFKDANLRQYFNSQPWYNGYRDEVPAGELSSIEKYNIQFIQRYE